MYNHVHIIYTQNFLAENTESKVFLKEELQIMRKHTADLYKYMSKYMLIATPC